MELQKCGHQACYSEIHRVSKHYQHFVWQLGVVCAEDLVVITPQYGLIEVVGCKCCCEVCHDQNVNEKEKEVFAVPEPNTVIDPRAVMVHVKNASVASRAVMASFRLKNVAHQAVAASLIFIITKMETPKDRNLSWVCSHCLKEWPHKHEKQEIVND